MEGAGANCVRCWRHGGRFYPIVRLRECPLPKSLSKCVGASRATRYWREHVTTHTLREPDPGVSPTRLRCCVPRHFRDTIVKVFTFADELLAPTLKLHIE